MLRFLLAILLLAIGPPAVAQPVCVGGLNTPACRPQGVAPQQTDVVLGQQATGPSAANQVVKFSLSQLSGIGTSATGQLLINISGAVQGVTIGSGLSLSGGVLSATGGGGGGSVTSVGLTMPGGFTVLNSPVTSTGTLTVTLNTTSGAILYNNSGALQPVTIGSGLTFTGGTLTASGSGGGTVTTTGSPASGNLTFFSGASTITNGNLTGDVTTSGASATTLATVNSTVGTYTNASVTVNAKGLVTAASNGAAPPTGANPTATGGPSAVNGSALTFMRSDAAPAIQLATTTQSGLVEPDGQTIAVATGRISTTVPDRTATTSTAIVAADMGGQVNLNGSSLTLTIPAISSTIFAPGMAATVCNQATTPVTISSTPALNGYSSSTIPATTGGAASCISLTSNGASLDVIPVLAGITGGMSLTAAGQVFSGGVHPTAFSNGTASSGTVTIDCGNNPIQTLTNGGAFTLAMGANDGSCVLRVTNNASAGTITFSGFSEGSNTGDSLTTTNGNKFDIALTRIGGNPHFLVSALQ